MPQEQAPPDPYRTAGVDVEKGARLVARIGALARATRRPGAEPLIGGFGGVFDLAALGLRDPLLVAASDGVGTKLLLARRAGRLFELGIDLVAMCVNDVLVHGAEPLFFLDYYATGRLELEPAERLIAGMVEGCRRAGCALLGGETAEMPGVYGEDGFDLAGFALGAVERERLLPRPARPGDVLLALAASGPHANGFSLIRRLLGEEGLDVHDPAPFAPDSALAEVLLAPTRIYVSSLLGIVGHEGVRAFAHITGGGLVDNLPRVLPRGCVARLELASYALAPLFRWLAARAGLDAWGLARTFNCGVGMVVVVAAEHAAEIEEALNRAGERVWRLGSLLDGDGPPRVELVGAEEAWGLPASRC